ncbi:MAG: hypothetical protein WD738_12325 [Pirellulales bacterium]
MRKTICIVASTVLAVASVLGPPKVLAAPVLAVDFGRVTATGPTPVQPGFSGMAGAPVEPLSSAPFGPYTVTVSGEGFFSAGFNAGNVDPSVAALYEDYYYHNSTTNGVGITLSIAGVTPNTPYDVTLWSYDEDNIFSPTPTTWGPTGSTSGTSGVVVNFAAPYPTDLSYNRTTIRVNSTTSTLDIFGTTTAGSGGTRLNGFKLSRIPEPCTAALTTMGALLLLGFQSVFRARR